jgi:AmmeMemoRadiSam system protein B
MEEHGSSESGNVAMDSLLLTKCISHYILPLQHHRAINLLTSVFSPAHLPTGVKAIIAPHAGYSYSGPTAAAAYRSIDPAGKK